MRIVLDLDGVQREVDVVLEDPLACVGDLLAALPPSAGSTDGTPAATAAGVLVDGRFFPADHGLDELNLHEGAEVAPAAGPRREPAPRSGPPLMVVGGPDAGRTVLLDGRAATIGRDPGCDVVLDDPTVSSWHAELVPGDGGGWSVRDLGSSNGIWVDDVPVDAPRAVAPGVVVRLGASRLTLRAALPVDRPLGIDPLHRASGGVVPFNRPPRGQQPAAVDAVALPAPPPVTARARALSIAAIAAPIVLGGVLVWVTGSWRFALFLLLSPVMALASWASSRRQVSKETAGSDRAFQRALERLERELAAQRRAERRRREQVLVDLAEITRRVCLPSSALWERRPRHDDFLLLRAGIGDVPWEPPVEVPRDGTEPAVAAALAAASTLPSAPVAIDLRSGGVVGLVGDRQAALDLARSLVCQAAAQHGPADLGIAVLTDEPRARDWDWAKWLPHARTPDGVGRWLAAGRKAATALANALLAAAPVPPPGGVRIASDGASTGRTTLLVLDDVTLTTGRRAPARLVLAGEAGPVAGIVLAETIDQLPAVTTTVVHLHDAFGCADLRRPADGFAVDDLVIDGITDRHARLLARTLARYEDPELTVVGASVPRRVRLLPVLGLDESDVDVVLEGWTQGLPDPAPATPIGVGEDGIVALDLVADGPHGLIGGTTGSGKSELLRSMVAGMAARVDPQHLTFVLVDYKGGSAFDRCADLPHTVGMVTDLDEHLGERALRSLEAELHHRELLLRQDGAQDLPAYLAAGARRGPLPRLVVVIDEFATLAAELPDFLGALVGIAQRGRSLGVHLILATQRPSGAVDANIKANTNLRIALRVQDNGDSVDIIDTTDAAAIPRSTPGRAYVRRGPSDVVMVQTALSTAAAVDARPAPVRFEPFGFVPTVAPVEDGGRTPAASDLDRLVDTITTAFERTGAPRPRRPWLEPLPDRIELAAVVAAAADGAADGDVGSIPIGLVDDPDRQRQQPFTWDPGGGHLGIFGMVGSGTTTALTGIVAAIAARRRVDEVHVHAIDMGAGGLAPLLAFPQVGTVVPASAAELRARLLRHLRRELDRRRALTPQALLDEPWLVLLVDGIGSLLAEFESADGLELGEVFKRVFADGPTVRMVAVVAGDRAGEVPMRYAASIANRLLLRHADPQEFAAVGLRPRQLPRFVPGLAIDASTQQVVQLAEPGDLAERAGAARDAAARTGSTVGVPAALRTLPAVVGFAEVAGGEARAGGLWLPVGLAEEDLTTVGLPLHPEGHALVTGPPRSGVSSTLALLAAQVRAADPGAVILGLCDARSPLYGIDPLDGAGGVGDLRDVLAAAGRDHRRWVVLIEDAPVTADVDGVLAGLVSGVRDDVHVVGGGRSEAWRAAFSHWSRGLRSGGVGVLLRPDLSTDGDLLGVRLPRRAPVDLGVPGRGFVAADGQAHLVQIARHRNGPLDIEDN